MCKEFGYKTVAYVDEGKKKKEQILNFRNYFNQTIGKRNNKVQIMVTSLKSICQSINLVKCQHFISIEPHLINVEAVQFRFRRYRISQAATKVSITQLIHEGLYVEELIYYYNKNKDNFAAKAKQEKIVELVKENIKKDYKLTQQDVVVVQQQRQYYSQICRYSSRTK